MEEENKKIEALNQKLLSYQKKAIKLLKDNKILLKEIDELKRKNKQLSLENVELNKRLKDCTYYGSPLNKLVDEECTRNMTAMNIDLIMYEKNKKIIRIIESKHENEHMGYAQRRLLMLLSIFEKTIKQYLDYNFEIYTIRGNPPYNSVSIQKMKEDIIIDVNHNELINFLNFKLSFEDLVKMKGGKIK